MCVWVHVVSILIWYMYWAMEMANYIISLFVTMCSWSNYMPSDEKVNTNQ